VVVEGREARGELDTWMWQCEGQAVLVEAVELGVPEVGVKREESLTRGGSRILPMEVRVLRRNERRQGGRDRIPPMGLKIL
jgi:hypothetical protein